MQSDMRASRLGRLGAIQARKAGSVQNRDAYQFRISTTCPPSTRVTFRGGCVWQPPSAVGSYGWFIPSYEIDLTDGDKTGRGAVMFTIPYGYREWTIVLRTTLGLAPHEEWPEIVPDDAVWLLGNTGEHATAEAAELAMIERERSGGQDYGIPVVGVIMRNNGNTTAPNQFLPVDPINRGRSYLFYNCAQGWYTV